MEEFFQSCVDLYAELTDTDPANYPAVGTPFGSEHTDIEDGQGGPRGEISSPSMEALANLLGIDAPMGPPYIPVIVGGQPLDDDDPNPLPPSESGQLQPIAAKCLMKFLYGARMARYDILRAICHTASCVTKWTEQNDLDLYRLICYMRTTLRYKMVSWVGDPMENVMIKQ